MDKPEFYTKLSFSLTTAEKFFIKNWHFITWGDTPQSIIDVGIGDGKVTKHAIIPRLPHNIKEYIGSDFSEQMLNWSENVIDYPKYETLKMDICAEKIPKEYQSRFDKVFASFLLHILGAKLK